MLITAGAFGIQVPFEICIAKDSGSVDLKYLWTLTISCCFWTLYSWFVNDMLFYYACLSTIILMLSAIFFWHRYSPKTKDRLRKELRQIDLELETIEEPEISVNICAELGQIEEMTLGASGSEIGFCLSARELLQHRRSSIIRRLGLKLNTTPTL